jgi:hypothetical protein
MGRDRERGTGREAETAGGQNAGAERQDQLGRRLLRRGLLRGAAKIPVSIR